MRRIETNVANQPTTHASGILSGNDLYVSGQVGIDLATGKTVEGIGTQAGVALGNFISIVEAAGGEAGDVARLTIYVADMSAFQAEVGAFMAAFSGVFGDGYVPAMTLVGVTALMSPDFLVEIEGQAKIGAPS